MSAMSTVRSDAVSVQQDSSGALASERTIRMVLGAPPIVAVTLAIPLTLRSVPAGLLLFAFSWGWTVLAGPCGCAHAGALNALARDRTARWQWIASMIAYVVAGSLSGALVGSFLGLLGRPFGNFDHWWPIMVGVAVICLLRETGLMRIPLLEAPRQTRFHWFMGKPMPFDAAMWGFDVGLVFATWLSFSGAWLLATIVVLTGQPLWGAAIFSSYWLGRAAPHWLEPIIMRRPQVSLPLVRSILRLQRQMRWTHAYGLAAFIVALVLAKTSFG